MGLYYQAEYRVGRRGGRVCRSYSGFRAFLAIFLDLVFGTLLDVIAAVFALAARSLILTIHLAVEVVKLCWRLLVLVMTILVHALALPYKLMQRRLDSPSRRHAPSPIGVPHGRPLKPDWGLGHEV
jgi:hypothetical protein